MAATARNAAEMLFFFAQRMTNIIIEENDELSIHFLELGNKYSGDSVYIKANDYDILIDAGSRQNSASTLKNYINQHCEDGKLEYVIATHAHQDHIAAFVGKSDDPGIFKSYEIDTLIDFPKTNTAKQAKVNNILFRISLFLGLKICLILANILHQKEIRAGNTPPLSQQKTEKENYNEM